MRLSPLGTFNDMHDDDPETTFGTAAARLSDLGLAYLHTSEPPAPDGPPAPAHTDLSRWERYAQALLAANEFLFLD